jgi:hypothetical protein
MLALLWPRSTATSEYSELPPWLEAQLEFEATLRDVSTAAQQVRSELEAAHGGAAEPPEIEAARRRSQQGAPTPANGPKQPAGGDQPPADPPCFHKGTTGSGAFRGEKAPPGEMTCWYQCGDLEIQLLVSGNSGTECEKPINFERAAKKAAQQRKEEALKKHREGR